MKNITFRDFSRLMQKRRRTADDLVDQFRGKLDDSRGFFERALECRWYNVETRRYEDRGDTVIPYKSVIEFYLKEQHYLEDSKAGVNKVTMRAKSAIREREIIEVF